MSLLSFVSFIICYVKLMTQFIKKMSENMSNALMENANIEINEKNFLLFPASQINVRFLLNALALNARLGTKSNLLIEQYCY